MQKIKYTLFLFCALFWSFQVNAQCPAAGSITTTTSSAPNTCAGNGTITATFTSNPNITIQLIKAGTILNTVIAPTSPYTWSTLQPGADYQVKIICTTNNSTVYTTNNVTVADNYVPITNASIATSNVCTNFTAGGTFTVNSVTGGTAPYTYSVIQSTDPAYADGSSSYSSSNTKTVSTFGTYQIRVKDACGNYKTFTQIISPTVNPITFYWKSKKICASSQVTASSWFFKDPATNAATTLANYLPTGINIIIKADNAAGATLYSGTYTGGTFTYTPTASHIYYITTTTACGGTASYTYDMNDASNNPEFNSFDVISSTTGCGAAATMTISGLTDKYDYWQYPITVTIKNSGGTTVATLNNIAEASSWTKTGLPIGTYTVTYTDACNQSLTKTITDPSTAGAPVLSLNQTVNWRCGDIPALSQPGTTQALVQILGYLPDRANAVVKITSGPSNVGVVGSIVDNQYWGWSNLIPGTYTVSYTSCGTTYTGSFTIAANNSNILNQSLTSTATSFCTGGGAIASNVVYNGGYSTMVELLNSAGTVVATSANGSFTNIAPGTYSTRMKVTPWCTTPPYYVTGSTVTLTDATSGPKISSATGVICESAPSVPLSTGSAYLTIAGVAPYIIQYRVSGSGAAYTTINTSSTNVQISNLTANTIYEVILTDACGATYNTTVLIKTMANLVTQNTLQPCVNNPYTLSMKDYAGATYQWTDPSGNIISNTSSYSFANYIAANNGTYTCKISWGTCVTRTVNITTNSTLCGSLPISLISFKGGVNGCKAILNWATATELNFNHFELEMSLDGVTFSKIATIVGSNLQNGSSYIYQYLQNTNKAYYRLKQVDNNNNFEYSQTIEVKTICSKSAIAIAPNPVQNDLRVSSSDAIKTIRIFKVDGRLMMVKSNFSSGQTINVSSFAKGTYILQIETINNYTDRFKFIKD